MPEPTLRIPRAANKMYLCSKATVYVVDTETYPPPEPGSGKSFGRIEILKRL